MLRGWLNRRRASAFNKGKGWRWAGSTGELQNLPEWPLPFWDHRWVKRDSLRLRDPLYNEDKLVFAWSVDLDGLRYPFAAAEFSNGVWGFFLPVGEMATEVPRADFLRDPASLDRLPSGRPVFPYFADAALNPLMRKTDEACECCGAAPGELFTGPIYCQSEVEKLCLDCIATGLAADYFDGSFNDVVISWQKEDGTEQVLDPEAHKTPPEIVREVTCHTPGYESWQGNNWSFHCGDACVFQGDATEQAVKEVTAEARALWNAQNAYNRRPGAPDGDFWSEVMTGYKPGHGLGVYHFKCRKCGVDTFLWDCD